MLRLAIWTKWRRTRSSSTSTPRPGRSSVSTWPRSVRIGAAVTSSASPVCVRVRPQAILGTTVAACSAAAQAMLDLPVLHEIFDVHAEAVAPRRGRHHGARAAELDGLQADAARRLGAMLAGDVVHRMDAFIGADGDFAGLARHRRHAGEIVRHYRLLKKSRDFCWPLRLDGAHIGMASSVVKP